MDFWKISSFQECAELIFQMDAGELKHSISEMNPSQCYKKYYKRKNNGEYRELYKLKENTAAYQLQNLLYQNYLKNLYLPDYVFGFRKNCSFFDHLTFHTTNRSDTCFLALDIKDFFPSISREQMKSAFMYYISDDCSRDERKQIFDAMMKVSTLNGHLVQGAITSPAISNLAFRQIDMRIDSYCTKLGVKYSRYADDLLFSSNSDMVHQYRFLSAIKHILKDGGFYLNTQKTKSPKGRLCLNGYIVDSSVHLSRRKLKELTKLLWEMELPTFDIKTHEHTAEATKHYLAGYRSFLIQTKRYCKDKTQINHMDRLIKRIESAIDKYL